jgi:hypothetical protein
MITSAFQRFSLHRRETVDGVVAVEDSECSRYSRLR